MDFTQAKLYAAGGDVSKRWYVYFFIRNPATGRMQMVKRRSGLNRIKGKRERKTEGLKLVATVNQLLKEGWTPFAQSKKILPLKQILDELLDTKKSALRRRTWQSYKYSLDILFKWMDKKGYAYFLPDQFTIPIALSFTDYLQSEKKFSGKAFNSNKNHVSIFFNAMVEREIIAKNPFKRIKNLKEEVGKNIAFNESQREKLIQYMKVNNFRLYLFTQFVYFTMIRPLELLRLLVSNVDIEKRIITIYGDQSKNKKTESVVIPDSFLPIVKAMNLESFQPTDFLFGKKLATGPESYSRNRVTKMHSDILRDLKFNSVYTLYSWKHSGAVSAYHAGIDLYSLMRQLRHGTLNQTQIYLKSLGLQPNLEFASKMK